MDNKPILIINTHFNRASWMLWFTKPIVEINGVEHKKKWGRRSYPVEPGRCELRVYYPWLYNYYSSLTSKEIIIKMGDRIRLDYDASHAHLDDLRVIRGKLEFEENLEKAKNTRL